MAGFGERDVRGRESWLLNVFGSVYSPDAGQRRSSAVLTFLCPLLTCSQGIFSDRVLGSGLPWLGTSTAPQHCSLALRAPRWAVLTGALGLSVAKVE